MISAMVSVNVEVVNFMDVFNSFCPQFNGDERKCCVVVSTNELSYILANIFLNCPNFRGRARIHNGTERMPAK